MHRLAELICERCGTGRLGVQAEQQRKCGATQGVTLQADSP